MKLLYDNNTGVIHYSIYDRDLFSFVVSTIVELVEFQIDEIGSDNKELCHDLSRYGKQPTVDKEGLGKYYILNDELYLRDDWEEFNDV